jgi:signal transduction histidine kinase
VILNLAGNAIKFTENGSVRLRISSNEVIAANNESQPARYELWIEVADTGIGLTPDQLDTIFESFTQASGETSRKFGGTGLGLSISKQLVEMQGGKISVSSEFGKGSVFSFFIPYQEGDKGNVASREQAPTPEMIASLKKARVLAC